MEQESVIELDGLLRERIIILDGAMGSMLKNYKLSELLCLEKPALISEIHEAYLEAGADIITTCSFNANTISLANYKIGAEKAYEISKAAGALARQAADTFSTADKKRFVAGSMGPTSKSACFVQDINDPGKRSITWDELEAAYYENARGLLDGGADILLIETIFDTINAKAAIAAVIRLREERNAAVPLIISATIANNAGRLLCGQSLEAFVVSVAHADPLALGINCSYGADAIFPHLSAFSAFTSFPVCCYPNAGLPTRAGDFYETPEKMAQSLEKYFDKKLLNIVGGCCGTTPAHIAAIAKLAKEHPPRPLKNFQSNNSQLKDFQSEKKSKHCFLSGLEIHSLPSDASSLSVDFPLECFNKNTITHIGGDLGSAKAKALSDCLKNNSVDDAVELASEIIDGGAKILPVHIDSELPEGKETVIRFFNNALFDPGIARYPVLLECSNHEFLETALKCIPGKSLVSHKSFMEGKGELLSHAGMLYRLGAAIVQ